MPVKRLTWNDEDGVAYNISYSEELQQKNIEAVRRQTLWVKRGLIVMVLLLFVLSVFTVVILYTLFKLDAINFFTRIAFR